jgi:hypothetical protein
VTRRTGDIYFLHPIYRVNGIKQKLYYVTVKLPDKEFVQEYERKANKWKNRLKIGVRKSMRDFDRKGEIGETIFDLINKVNNNRDKYKLKGKLNLSIIETKLGISNNKARQIASMLQQRDSVG